MSDTSGISDAGREYSAVGAYRQHVKACILRYRVTPIRQAAFMRLSQQDDAPRRVITRTDSEEFPYLLVDTLTGATRHYIKESET